MTRIRAPLSIEQLKEIQGRNESADVLALLWEVRRLRAIAATADELERNLGPARWHDGPDPRRLESATGRRGLPRNDVAT